MKSLQQHVDSIRRRLTRHRRFPLLVSRRGARFLLDPRNWLDCELAMGRPYENEVVAHAAATMERERLDVFVDIGANLGLYTVLLGQLPFVTQVVAFEPVRRNFNQLLANVFANRLDGKVEAHRLALGDKAEQLTIHIDPRSTAIARFDRSLEARDPASFALREVVSVAPFDTVVSLTQARVFVKIDVEGHAAAVLRGMDRFLAENDAVVQVELFPEEEGTITEIFDRHGYEAAEAFGRDRYFRRRAPRQDTAGG